jgi:hypothetical protein
MAANTLPDLVPSGLVASFRSPADIVKLLTGIG